MEVGGGGDQKILKVKVVGISTISDKIMRKLVQNVLVTSSVPSVEHKPSTNR